MEYKSWELKLAAFDKRIKAFAQGYRQNLALLGDNAEEISYLLENYLVQKKETALTYIHASTAYCGKREFLKAIIFSLLSDYNHTVDTLDCLINRSSSFLPATTECIKDCLQKTNVSFLEILEVINKFINETKRNCVLIVEEFFGLGELFGDCYQDFSKFIILQRNCMIILTTSCLKQAEKVLSSELNLLFGNFEKVFLNESTPLDNFLYLKKLVEPLAPSPLFLSFFVNILGSNIVYYDFMAPVIARYYSSNDETVSISAVIDEALYDNQTYFFQKFIKQVDCLKPTCRDFGPLMRLLCSLSEGYLRKKDLRSLEIYTPEELANKLQRLSDLNYIENFGNIYKLKNTLFSFWLSHIFTFYFSWPVCDSRQRKVLYRRKLQETLLLFKEEFFQDRLKRVLQLFSAFQNDVLRIGQDRYRLPSIEKTKVISYPQRDFHLLIGEGNEIIFAGIKENNADDADIFDFLEKGTNVKGKKVRKIFISLDRLSPTARLIAKNNKLTAWDLNEINRLLSIYNKPIVTSQSF